MTTVLVIIVILLTMAYFYLKCPLMTSLATMISAILAMIVAFSFYEQVAELLITRGYGGDWPLAGCFVVVFIVALAVLRSLSDVLIGGGVDLGPSAKSGAAIVCGLVTGMIVSGSLLVAMGMTPVQHKLFYNRFPPERPIAMNNPSVPLLNPDGFVSGLYGWISRGSLASGRSFAVVQADYLTKNHLNRYRLGDEIGQITAPEALTLPRGGAKRPVRIWPMQDRGDLTVVRVGVSTRSIADGGAADASRRVRFSTAQLRLICKPADNDADNLGGSGTAVWPKGMFKNGRFIEKELGDVVSENETLYTRDGYLWMDAAFEVPSGQKPVAFQFKQNAMLDLTGQTPVPTSPEIEQELDAQPETADTPQP